MAYGSILGQNPTAQNTLYNNAQTSSIITANNVQGAIDQLFTSVSNGKQQIASAITDKGVSTSGTDSFATMAENIGKIVSGIDISLFNQEPIKLTELTGTIPLNSIWVICAFRTGSSAQTRFSLLIPALKSYVTFRVSFSSSVQLQPVYLQTNVNTASVSYATDFVNLTVDFNTGEYTASTTRYNLEDFNLLYTK